MSTPAPLPAGQSSHAVIRRLREIPGLVVFVAPASWWPRGDELGAGAFGAVWAVEVENLPPGAAEQLFSAETPPWPDTVAVKVSTAKLDSAAAIDALVAEATAHAAYERLRNRLRTENTNGPGPAEQVAARRLFVDTVPRQYGVVAVPVPTAAGSAAGGALGDKEHRAASHFSWMLVQQLAPGLPLRDAVLRPEDRPTALISQDSRPRQWEFASRLSARMPQLSATELLGIMRALVAHVWAAATLGRLAHGDLKADNVLYDRETQRVVVIDYGQACVGGSSGGGGGDGDSCAPAALKDLLEVLPPEGLSAESATGLLAFSLWQLGLLGYQLLGGQLSALELLPERGSPRPEIGTPLSAEKWVTLDLFRDDGEVLLAELRRLGPAGADSVELHTLVRKLLSYDPAERLAQAPTDGSEATAYMLRQLATHCAVCRRPAPGFRCTGCRISHYCSTACQLLDWEAGGHEEGCEEPGGEAS